jgi:tryptophan-rich sensory protein
MKKRRKKHTKLRNIKRKKKIKFIENPKLLVYSALAVVLAAIIGSLFTKIDAWYEAVKPAIAPPNFVFPIVWTILFALLAVSLYLSLLNADKKERKILIILFAINLVLNVLWSALFFSAQNPAIAFADLILLFISILLLIQLTWKVSPLSSWLLLPYALWVSFAGLLNYVIAFM